MVTRKEAMMPNDDLTYLVELANKATLGGWAAGLRWAGGSKTSATIFPTL